MILNTTLGGGLKSAGTGWLAAWHMGQLPYSPNKWSSERETSFGHCELPKATAECL